MVHRGQIGGKVVCAAGDGKDRGVEGPKSNGAGEVEMKLATTTRGETLRRHGSQCRR